MSVNLELPTAEGLKRLAPNKHRRNILTPMRQIQQGIIQNKNELVLYRNTPSFVPAGQSTQMIVGATPESDYQIMMVAENLYKKFDLKRVYYSAFVSVNEDKELPALQGGPPLLREHRLYQADWLLRFYGFEADELLSEEKPNFNILLDPKADWALRHLEQFPVEINRADYNAILRVPGIGVKSAQRIVRARRNGNLNFEDLKKIGVTLKRALYFITCSGKMMYPTKIEEDYITRNLLSNKEKLPFDKDGMTYKQLSLFDDNQEMLFNQKVKSYMEQGMSFMEAYIQSSHTIAVHGASEHQVGLALDIVCSTYYRLDEAFGDTEAGKWLAENSYQYGFILRYTKDKEEITGIEYEPWHFRYVGIPHAAMMTQRGMALEEYIEFIKAYRYGENPYIVEGKYKEQYAVSYIKANAAGQTAEIAVNDRRQYSISGNNCDGFIVSIK